MSHPPDYYDANQQGAAYPPTSSAAYPPTSAPYPSQPAQAYHHSSASYPGMQDPKTSPDYSQNKGQTYPGISILFVLLANLTMHIHPSKATLLSKVTHLSKATHLSRVTHLSKVTLLSKATLLNKVTILSRVIRRTDTHNNNSSNPKRIIKPTPSWEGFAWELYFNSEFHSLKMNGAVGGETGHDVHAESSGQDKMFRDLSSRAQVFRERLIQEFQLFEGQSSVKGQPMISSEDFMDYKVRNKALADNPNQLIKFKPFRRVFLASTSAQNPASQEHQDVSEAEEDDYGSGRKDRRLLKMKNKGSLPLGAWAASITANVIYQRAMLALIIFNTVTVTLEVELRPREAEFWQLFQFFTVFNLFAVCAFVIDIALKWIDDIYAFWMDGWNIADFCITFVSILPVVFLAVPKTPAVVQISEVLKTLQILRSMKLVIYFNSLKTIVLCIIEAFSSMAFIMLLIFLVAFIYAVVGVNVFYSYAVSERDDLEYQFYFSNIASIMQALFQLLTLDKWDLINRDIAKVADPALTYIYVISWVFLGSFIFRNIFIGVMVTNFDRISMQVREHKAEQSKAKTFEKMRKKLDRLLVAAKATNKYKEYVHCRVYRSSNVPPTLDMHGEDEVDALMSTMHKLLIQSQISGREWEKTVQETMTALTSGYSPTLLLYFTISSKRNEVYWPKHTLFHYLRCMEALQVSP
ncbi:MAG: hypothetical protein SGCHY_004678 [Lobulomycetales sp.]